MLIEAARAAQEELARIIEETAAIEDEKEKLRELQCRLSKLMSGMSSTLREAAEAVEGIATKLD